MTNWLLMFRDETYDIVRQHGQIGVLDQHRKRFATIRPDDNFIAYLSQPGRLDGHGTFVGSPSESSKPLWGTREKKVAGTSNTETVPRYPWRCAVEFEVSGVARTANNLLWHLGCWPEQMNTTPGNYLFIRGGFTEINDADYRRLLGILDGDPLPVDKG